MNGGVVILNGPTENHNGTLDVDGSLVINGGFLVGVGSATGTVTDGLYSDGIYTPGAEASSFTIAGIVTGEGSERGGRRGGGGRP